VHRHEQSKKAKHRINRRIYKRFSEQGVEIPYNTHDVNLYDRTEMGTETKTEDRHDEKDEEEKKIGYGYEEGDE